MRHVRTLKLIDDVARSGSIRRSAERVHLTASALTRQIQDFERELGTPIFERLPNGMRLNAAGELVIRHIRDQISDLERLQSQIADLAGMRGGHVAVACSQAFSNAVMPDEIHTYRKRHPRVTFTMQVRDRMHAVTSLMAFEADLALILQPPPLPDLRVLYERSQPLCALMRTDHRLAGEGPIRLRDCLMHDVAMPGRSLAIRYLLDAAIVRAELQVKIAVESESIEFLRNYLRCEPVTSFQAPSGVPAEWTDICTRPIDARDIAPMRTVLGQLRGRVLSVATAKFADQVASSLHHRGWNTGARTIQ